jgi:hypothetical protein
MKWWKKVFFHPFTVSMINALKAYLVKQGKKFRNSPTVLLNSCLLKGIIVHAEFQQHE